MTHHAPRTGASAVEFALTLPILMSILSGVVDYAWYFHQRDEVLMAVRDATRLGATVPLSEAPAVVTRLQVASRLSELGYSCPSAHCIINVSIDTASHMPRLRVQASLPYESPIGLVPVPTTLDARATLALERFHR